MKNNPLKKIFKPLLDLYAKTVVYLIKSEDTQKRKTLNKKVRMMNNGELPKLKKLSNYLSLKLGKKKFSVKEQLLFIETIIISTKFSNPLQEPLLFMSKRLDVRPYFRKTCKEMLEDLEFAKLHESLEKREVLQSEHVALIKVAQTTGDFLPTYEYISSNLRERLERNSKLKTLLIYPILLGTMLVGIECLMALMVVPKVANVFDKGEEPNAVKSYMQINDLLTNHLFELLIGIGLVITLMVFFFKLKPTKYLMDLLILQVPKIGDFIIKWEISKFFDSLNAMTVSKSSLKEGLDTSLDLISNVVIKYSLSIDIAERGGKTYHLYDILKDCVYINLEVKNQLLISKESKSSGQEVMNTIVMEYKDSLKKLLETPMTLITPSVLIIGSIYIMTRLLPLFTSITSIGM